MLHRRLLAANEIRNKAAHHERLFSIGKEGISLKEGALDIAELLFLLDPEIAVNVYGMCGTSATGMYLDSNPCPAQPFQTLKTLVP